MEWRNFWNFYFLFDKSRKFCGVRVKYMITNLSLGVDM